MGTDGYRVPSNFRSWVPSTSQKKIFGYRCVPGTRWKKFLGTNGYRVPADKKILGTNGYRVPAKEKFSGTGGYRAEKILGTDGYRPNFQLSRPLLMALNTAPLATPDLTGILNGLYYKGYIKQ